MFGVDCLRCKEASLDMAGNTKSSKRGAQKDMLTVERWSMIHDLRKLSMVSTVKSVEKPTSFQTSSGNILRSLHLKSSTSYVLCVVSL
jgi:hypothetical protein